MWGAMHPHFYPPAGMAVLVCLFVHFWSSLIQSGPVRSGPVQFSQVQTGPVRYSLVQSSTVQFESGAVWCSPVQTGLVWSGLVWSSPVWSSPVRLADQNSPSNISASVPWEIHHKRWTDRQTHALLFSRVLIYRTTGR